MRKTIQSLLLLAILSSLACVVHSSQIRLDERRNIFFIDRSPVFLPKGEVLKALSMGYRGIVADWLWIKTVLYVGRRIMDSGNPYFVYMAYDGDEEQISEAMEHHAEFHQGGEAYDSHHANHHHAHIDQAHMEKVDALKEEIRKNLEAVILPVDSVYLLDAKLRKNLYRFENRGLIDGVYPLLDRVTTVDPHYIKPYVYGGFYMLHETGYIDDSIALLKKGRKNNPEYWEFPFYLGWIYWMYKGELETTHSYLLEAVGKKDCPGYVYRLLRGLTLNLKQTDMTRMFLEGIYEDNPDPEIRQNVMEILQALEEGSEQNGSDSH